MGGSDAVSLVNDLRLVAMICFMERFSHYVVFCRSLSGTGDEWLFFNDLPGTGSRGARHRLPGWQSVSSACARYEACPKMLLYENPIAAQKFIQERVGSDWVLVSPPSAKMAIHGPTCGGNTCNVM